MTTRIALGKVNNILGNQQVNSGKVQEHPAKIYMNTKLKRMKKQ